jgi:hypothetical protein
VLEVLEVRAWMYGGHVERGDKTTAGEQGAHTEPEQVLMTTAGVLRWRDHVCDLHPEVRDIAKEL